MLCFGEVQPGDNPELAQLIRNVLAEFDANKPGFASEDPETDCMYESYAAEGYTYFTLTNDKEQIVGGGGVAPLLGENLDYCEIQKMYFSPSIRGKQYGAFLLNQLLESAIDMGYRLAYIETLDVMHAAIRLYEKAGFEPLQSPKGMTGHTGCNQYYLLDLRHWQSNRKSAAFT